MTRWLVDECVHQQTIEYLRQQSFQLHLARDIAASQPDAKLGELAHRLNAGLITTDKDFGESMFRRQIPPLIIVLLRYELPQLGALHQALGRCLEQPLALACMW